MGSSSVVVWHRADLRVHDHPALHAARRSDRLVGLVVLDPRILEPTRARRVAWFKANVAALARRYASLGSLLVVRSGRPEEVVPEVAEEAAASEVHALSSYTPYGVFRDRETSARLTRPVRWHAGCYVHEPGTVVKKDGGPYSLFTPFYRAALVRESPATVPAPRSLPPPPHGMMSEDLSWQEGSVRLPPAGEAQARAAFTRFLHAGMGDYAQARDVLGVDGTSGVSAYLAVGALSPRLVFMRALGAGTVSKSWVRQLLWRDFFADVLFHNPDMLQEPLDPRWNAMRWREDRDLFEGWAKGRTGIPLVDAGMRQLHETGRMHNRVRMVCAQFCVKHLRLDWRWGEQHFKHHLIDGDTAQNVGNWQWNAGLGAGAMPYFRVLSPLRQAVRFDPGGDYLRRWVPECGGDPGPMPEAVVDLDEARDAYLEEARSVMSVTGGSKR